MLKNYECKLLEIETAFGLSHNTMDELKVGYASRLSKCIILKGFAGNEELCSTLPLLHSLVIVSATLRYSFVFQQASVVP